MPNKKIVKQADKVYSYIRRAGFWNQGIGFVFLVLAALCAYGLSRGGLAALFFLPIVGGLTQFILFLWVSVGLAYIVSGYYLHQKSGRLTKPALWVTAVLSLVTIQNIIPAIPLIFSVYALIKLRDVQIKDFKGRDYRIRFNVREFPAFTIALVLVFFTVLWVIQGQLKSDELSKKDSGTSENIKMGQKVACEPVPEPKGFCQVKDDAKNFSASFPSEPSLNSYPTVKAGTNATLNKKDGAMLYNYSLIPENQDNDDEFESYKISIVDYGSELDAAQLGDKFAAASFARLDAGQDYAVLCSSSNGAYNDPSLTMMSTFGDLPARKYSFTNGKSFNDSTCSFDSITFQKGRYSYSLSYLASPSQQTTEKFELFVSGFKLSTSSE